MESSIKPYFIITCEHAGNSVPDAYAPLFYNDSDVLVTHRGYDIGALYVAAHLAKLLQAPLFTNEVTRLLVDVNRSLTSKSLFSNYSKTLSKTQKQQLLEQYYYPYRNKVTHAIQEHVMKNRTVVHLSVHSFTPILNGVKRMTDLGLLFDPRSIKEKTFCHAMAHSLRSSYDGRVRYNYPYKGSSDGFTTSLRSAFGTDKYLGIELEITQKALIAPPDQIDRKIVQPLFASITHAFEG